MPLYEYIAENRNSVCAYCRSGFEMVRKINEASLTVCPKCGAKVRKKVSTCHAAVMDASEAQTAIAGQIRDYERDGRWSHAAELADRHAETTNDSGLKERAKDNYKKAGYDAE